MSIKTAKLVSHDSVTTCLELKLLFFLIEKSVPHQDIKTEPFHQCCTITTGETYTSISLVHTNAQRQPVQIHLANIF